MLCLPSASDSPVDNWLKHIKMNVYFSLEEILVAIWPEAYWMRTQAHIARKSLLLERLSTRFRIVCMIIIGVIICLFQVYSKNCGVKLTPPVLIEDHTMHFAPVLNLWC